MLENRRKALVVDDESDVRLFVRTILETEGWHVVEAVNGQEAIDMANDEAPDLIVLDLMMPVKDGFETFKELREGVFTKDIPVVMLTAINQFEQEAKEDEASVGNRYGVARPEGFVEKPVDPVFLLYTINGAVR
ncbi:MAG TPA: response regulator [Candidatus Hydrogenedentes bacterium]|nr:response regulator [Candidatus Hydrogenedentota bacterium]HPC17739.1 response regulator [Candidatus Hydrogenedentota bacterium]HRT20127.1 response regulator [Candidatus Hydrogenedentota bacterium]HRT66717.1 response regulator [Candidatus Hydrogenedentota bacterium]